MADLTTSQIKVMPTEPKDMIRDLYSTLKQGQQEGKELSSQGQLLLDSIESGQLTPNGFNAYLQGVTSNFSDELIGSIYGALGSNPKQISEIAKEYGYDISPVDVGIGLERIGLEQYRKESPGKAMGYELLGGATQAVALPGMSTMTKGKAFLSGLGAGGVAGYGAAEGTAGEQIGTTALSSGAGGAFGLAMKPITTLIGNVGKPIIKSMFGSPERSARDAANKLVKSAIESDAKTIDEAINIVLQKTGKQYTLADLGPNTRAYLDAVNVLPGPAKKDAVKFLSDRDKGIPTRLTSDLQQAFGTKASYFDDFKALQTARTEMGNKLYKNALKKQIPVGSELNNLLSRPSIQDAFNRGVNIAKEKGIKTPEISISADGIFINTKSNLPLKSITTEGLHYIKMGLDDVVFTGKAPTSGIGKTQLNAIKDTRIQFLNYIDAKNPSYKNARQAWAGDTAALDAMQEGRNFLKADPDELLADISNMSRSEKEAFRIGAMDTLIKQVGGSEDLVVSQGKNVAYNLLKDPNKLKLIKATFPNTQFGKAKFNQFINNFKDEIEMKRTSSTVLGGSQTAARQEAVGAIKETVKSETPLDIQQVIFKALKDDTTNVSDKQLRETANRVVNILTETNPNRLQTIAKELQSKNVGDVVADVLKGGFSKATSPFLPAPLLGQGASNYQQEYFPAEKQFTGILGGM